jgi:hypothetical protein
VRSSKNVSGLYGNIAFMAGLDPAIHEEAKRLQEMAPERRSALCDNPVREMGSASIKTRPAPAAIVKPSAGNGLRHLGFTNRRVSLVTGF